MRTRELLWKSLKCLSSCHGRRHVIRTLVIVFVFLPTCDIGKSHEERSPEIILQISSPLQAQKRDMSVVPLRKQFLLHKMLHGAAGAPPAYSLNTLCLMKKVKCLKQIPGGTMNADDKPKKMRFSTKPKDTVSSHIDTSKTGNRKRFLVENISKSTTSKDLLLHPTLSQQYHVTQTLPTSNGLIYPRNLMNNSRKQSLRNIHQDIDSDSCRTYIFSSSDKMFGANMTTDPITPNISNTVSGTTVDISTKKMLPFSSELMGTTEMLTTLGAIKSPVLKEASESHDIKNIPLSLMNTQAVKQLSTSESLPYSESPEQLTQMKKTNMPSLWNTTETLITKDSQTPSITQEFLHQAYLSRTLITRSCCAFSYETCRHEAHLYLTQDLSSMKDECPENVTSQSRSVVCTRASEVDGINGYVLPAPRCLCAHVTHCILDVSHRAHNCINGDLCKYGLIIKAKDICSFTLFP